METGTPGGFVPAPLPRGGGPDHLEMNAVRATSSGPVRVLTVDDHEPFLEVAHEMIHSTSGFEAVARGLVGRGGTGGRRRDRP